MTNDSIIRQLKEGDSERARARIGRFEVFKMTMYNRVLNVHT